MSKDSEKAAVEVDDLKGLNRKIGDRVYSARMEKGYSREQLAKQSGLSLQFIQQVESGNKGMSAKSLHKISRALNVTTDFLIFGSNDTHDTVSYAAQALGNLQPDKKRSVEQLLIHAAEIVRKQLH